VLTAGSALAGDAGDAGDAIARDPEVRQARMVAEAARRRLVACMSHPEDGIDVAEAQEMLEAFMSARLLAKDAEDRVLQHRGLLTQAEVERRTARRHPAPAREPERPPRPGARLNPVWHFAGALVLAVAGAAAVALARHRGARRTSPRKTPRLPGPDRTGLFAVRAGQAAGFRPPLTRR
jgi:hypothetical protein